MRQKNTTFNFFLNLRRFLRKNYLIFFLPISQSKENEFWLEFNVKIGIFSFFDKFLKSLRRFKEGLTPILSRFKEKTHIQGEILNSRRISQYEYIYQMKVLFS